MAAASLHELVDGVHAWVQPDGSWWINNAGAVSDGGLTLIVDTCATEQRTRRFLDVVAAATGGAPVRLAVNTHEHGDHTYGNSLLPDDAVLFGHPNMRARLAVDRVIEACPPIWDPVPDWGDVRRRLPDVTVGDAMTGHVGRYEVQLLHPGHAAHTTGDLVAWLPGERIAFVGDLVFHGITPLVIAGSVSGASRALDWVAELGPALLVPGHGPIVDGGAVVDVVAAHQRYYRFVQEVADGGRRDGLSPLDAARRADLGEFASWPDAERLVLNLHRAYAEAERRDVDVFAAFGDAITWNGGPLTTHVCCAA